MVDIVDAFWRVDDGLGVKDAQAPNAELSRNELITSFSRQSDVTSNHVPHVTRMNLCVIVTDDERITGTSSRSRGIARTAHSCKAQTCRDGSPFLRARIACRLCCDISYLRTVVACRSPSTASILSDKYELSGTADCTVSGCPHRAVALQGFAK